MTITSERRAELVQLRKDLRKTRHLCEHGVVAPDPDDDRGCAGSIGRCRCCSQYFCYCDSGWGNDDMEGMTVWTSDLCPDCGGYDTEHVRQTPHPWTPWTV